MKTAAVEALEKLCPKWHLGTMAIDPDTKELYIWYGAEWVMAVQPESSLNYPTKAAHELEPLWVN